ncbi:MAG: GNAT family N-acetyltransferase [Caulobacteraceae bacterium]|nr:GNAT family N-acetyltransferase [Caulobacteraceae bacterium]
MSPADSQPIFITERLIVRPRTPADEAACLLMDGDPEVVRYVPTPWSDEAGHRAFLATRTAGPYPLGQGYWTITDRSDAFLGWVLLIPSDAIGPETEIGWRLPRAAWGKGYATEAARPVLRHAFETLGLDEVVADVLPGNAASMGVAAKLGLRLDQRKDVSPYIRFTQTAAGFRARAATS